ncbi:hypothetical protein ACOCJ4_06965 [Knoellia sp. CPCC 206435]|uniref:hypothetical protein n=1 Tax=Knoellia terrae TaxID=3404797 RepID=UPI003B4332DE
MATSSTTASATNPDRTWAEARANFAGTGSFTFEGKTATVSEAFQITRTVRGEVDRSTDASLVRTSITSPDPNLAVPGETVVLSVSDGIWMQMTEWKAPNRGKWLDLAAQGSAGVGQRTLLEEALLSFVPEGSTAEASQFSGMAPLSDTAKLLGMTSLPDSLQIDGDVNMTVTLDDNGSITHVQLDGAGLRGSSLPSEYAGAVTASRFEAEVDLSGSVNVKAPSADSVVSSLEQTD